MNQNKIFEIGSLEMIENHVKIFNKNIITFKKFGTRFLESQFGDKNFEFLKKTTDILNYENIGRFKYAIIRNPEDYLISAIKTLHDIHKFHHKKDITYDDTIEYVFLGMDTHWNPDIYHILYTYSLLSEILFIELKDLSFFLNDEINISNSYPKLQHSTFKNNHLNKDYYDRNDVRKILISSKYWEPLNHILKKEKYFYNRIISDCKIYKKNQVNSLL